jgi:predicted HD phosphohydrolase
MDALHTRMVAEQAGESINQAHPQKLRKMLLIRLGPPHVSQPVIIWVAAFKFSDSAVHAYPVISCTSGDSKLVKPYRIKYEL